MVVSASFALAVSEVNIFGFVRGGDSPLGLTLGLDLEGGTHLVYKAMPDDGREPTKDDMEGLRNIIDKRVNEFGVSEASVQLLGGGVDSVPDRVLVQIPGQTGTAITLKFDADTVTPETLQAFFRNELGRPEAAVTRNENGSLMVQLDDIQGESESDEWREAIISQYPVALQVGYVLADQMKASIPQADSPADAEDDAEDSKSDEEIATLPTLDEVRGAFTSVGRSDAVVDAVVGAEGLFSILMYGMDAVSYTHLTLPTIYSV